MHDWKTPTFDEKVFKAKEKPFVVCVFVINEGERIRAQIARMKAYSSLVDLIIADGGSTDGSLDTRYLADNDFRALLTKTGSGKLSAQMRMGLAWALRQGYEGVIVIDGNGKDGVDAIPRFVEKLQSGYDHVQGSRYVKGGVAENTPLSRHWGVKLLHAPLISLASRRLCTDTTNGFRGYSKRMLTDPRVQPFRDIFSAYELHYYLAIRSARLGFRTIEIPVSRVYPASGKAPTKIKGLSGNLKIISTLLKACVGSFDP